MNPSLLLIPDRYKAAKLYSQIPDSGAGDLTFARNSNATRVNSAGLIEKVRTNLLTWSEDFTNVFWTKQNVTVSSNAITAPNGALTADSLIASNGVNAACGVFASETTVATKTASFYVKKASKRWAMILGYNGLNNCWFDLDNAVIGTRGSNYSNSEIEELENGWFRISATLSASTALTPNLGVYTSDNDNSVICTGDGITPSIHIWGAQLETGDIATDYIPTTTAAVSVGITANIPRLDYTGGGCPSLLLEPQRTNLALFSEQFNNAYWTQNATVTANSTISPSGYQDADTFTDASNSYLDVRRSFTITASTAYTFSIFVKKTTGALTNYAGVGFSAGGGVGIGYAIFNTTTGAVNLADIAGDFALSAKSTSYGDYYRFEMTLTTGQTSLLALIYPALSQNGTTLSSNAQGSNVFWGAQLEVGSYPTSYIPTLGSSVTRLADTASKTGISSLIGQTEGVVFLDFVFNQFDTAALIPILLTNTVADQVYILLETNNKASVDFYFNGAYSAQIATATGFLVKGTRYKMALAYKANDFAFYINGQQIGTDNLGAVASLTKLNFVYEYSGGYGPAAQTINTAAIYTTRLSNAELATLTAL